MNNFQENFKRIEKKYVIGETQYRELMALIYYRLQYDKYRKYRIYNLYFDTPEYDLIRESIEKPLYKEKLRLRSYGVPKPEDEVFLEIKKKFDGVVYKRRVSMKYKEAVDYCICGNRPPYNNQIMSEIDWLMNRMELYPMVFLSYDRMAMKGIEDPDLRITFDSNMMWRTNQLDLAKGDFCASKIVRDMYIMEIKTCGAMPLWLSEALNSLEIYPKSFSKYGTIYKEELAPMLNFSKGEIASVK